MIGKISLVIQWLPRVLATVMLVEELLKAGTPGSVKRDKALEFLERQGLSERYVNVIGSLIDLVVDVLHATGLFKRINLEADDVIVDADLLEPAVKAATTAEEFKDVYKSMLRD